MPLWKRALDIVGASFGLLLLSPIMIAIALLVKFTSPGPVIFRQKRMGQGGRPFDFFKFRSMIPDAEHLKKDLRAKNELSGPVFKIKNDPRITPIGRILRKTSLDELPQFWNVLRGDMSLVGPRPPTLDEVPQYELWQRRRLDVTPGITCIWQVSGRSKIGFIEWVRMDIRYARNRTLANDLKLLAKTIPAVLAKDGAY